MTGAAEGLVGSADYSQGLRDQHVERAGSLGLPFVEVADRTEDRSRAVVQDLHEADK